MQGMAGKMAEENNRVGQIIGWKEMKRSCGLTVGRDGRDGQREGGAVDGRHQLVGGEEEHHTHVQQLTILSNQVKVRKLLHTLYLDLLVLLLDLPPASYTPSSFMLFHISGSALPFMANPPIFIFFWKRKKAASGFFGAAADDLLHFLLLGDSHLAPGPLHPHHLLHLLGPQAWILPTTLSAGGEKDGEIIFILGPSCLHVIFLLFLFPENRYMVRPYLVYISHICRI